LALASYRATIQVPHDRFAGKGNLDIWPNRIGECALAGVLQLFDRGYGLKELREWQVENLTHLRTMEWLTDPDEVAAQIKKQRTVIMPRLEPERVLDKLEKILYDAAGLTKEEAA
jgi:hypothetical protein